MNLVTDLSVALELRCVEFDPQLTLARLGEDLGFGWPTPSAGYVLESTPACTVGSVWMPINLPGVVTNGQSQVTLPLSAEAQFFRLRKP